MIFKETYRFSPVIYEGDLPWQEDYFHLKPEEITKEFLSKGLYEIDEEWWFKQRQRCLYGYTIPNAIDFGGDAFVDDVDVFWNDSKQFTRKIHTLGLEIAPNTCVIPQYNIVIKNREVWIPGRHYFYLNFWKILGIALGAKEKKEKGLIDVISKEDVPPKFTDLDYYFGQSIVRMFNEEMNISFIKARQKGYSEKMAAFLAVWNYLFKRYTQTIIAGGMSDDADNTYQLAKRGLDKLLNTQFFKETDANNNEYVHSKNSGSEIRMVSCKDNNQSLNRFRPFMVIYEEGGKWKKNLLLETSAFTEAATRAEGIKTGYKVFVGTGGNMDMGAADLEEIHYNPKGSDVLQFRNVFEHEEDITVSNVGHFTPAWLYKIIDKDGNSLKKESIEEIYREFSKEKKDKQITFWTQNPIYASQAFMVPAGGFFGEVRISALNSRKAYIKTHLEHQICKRGYLEWINNKKPFDGVNWKEDEGGNVYIIEHPLKDSKGVVWKNLYKAGTDSYDWTDALTSTSLGSINIIKGFLNADTPSNMFVARITERPSEGEGGNEKFYEDTAKLCIYYGNAINLIEHSKTLIFEWYKNNGLSSLLKERPNLVISNMIKNSKTTNDYGIDANSMPQWLTKLGKWMDVPGSIDNMFDVEQITALAKFRFQKGKKYNCDITISSSLCVVLLEDEQFISVLSSTDNQQTQSQIRYREVNGQIVMV